MSNNRLVHLVAGACAMLAPATSAAASACPAAPPVPGGTASGRLLTLFGTISRLQGNQVIVMTRTGMLTVVDGTTALNAQQSVPLMTGRAVEILGTLGPDGVVHAEVIVRAKDAPASWQRDCLPLP